ncbi:hypothetical protein Tgr7_2781 [Thioalkalivibrio sulfidiphilus HL-EbGr7]|uniref:Porin domain-containing protein n=1 Tax=Thioalkalivibrio sulfidiphilus (strain HL-EbGR7) TaxID=396588 RepID=B8GNG4_THISH|nr:porin [Thioalkalivibrio sulfidiphilus]ACL73855.1 hypothetical protein Tgr7_2781 [Thioalkalivibrio sulfidiphilus HL-EbGr7]
MMKKTLIAAGVAAAMAIPAIAAADVQLSAQLQAELFSVSGDPRNGTNMNGKGLYIGDAIEEGGDINSGNWSRVDLRASHDLGNGLTGYAHLSANPNITTGNALGASREVLVGLRGAFGDLSVGRMASAYGTAGKDPFNATFMQARGNGGQLGGFQGLGNGSYVNNAIGYKNKFEMVSLNATLGLDQSANTDALSEDNNGQHMYALRVNVDLSPVEVWVAHTNADEYGQATRTRPIDTNFQATKLGAQFKTGAFGVVGQYENIKHDTAGVDTNYAGNFYMLSGTYSMGANTFMLGFGQFSAENDDRDQQWIAAGMRHAFNRNVSIHGGVRQTEYDLGAADTGNKETVVGAGMRVTF